MTDDYVTNAAWLANPSRPDTIDEHAGGWESRAPEPLRKSTIWRV